MPLVEGVTSSVGRLGYKYRWMGKGIPPRLLRAIFISFNEGPLHMVSRAICSDKNSRHWDIWLNISKVEIGKSLHSWVKNLVLTTI